VNRLSPNQEYALHFMSRADVARHVSPPNKWRIPQNLILVCGGQASQLPSYSADCPGCFVVVDAFLLVCLFVRLLLLLLLLLLLFLEGEFRVLFHQYVSLPALR